MSSSISLVHLDDHVAVVVLDPLERNAADDAVAHGLDDLAGLDDRTDVDAFARFRSRTR